MRQLSCSIVSNCERDFVSFCLICCYWMRNPAKVLAFKFRLPPRTDTEKSIMKYVQKSKKSRKQPPTQQIPQCFRTSRFTEVLEGPNCTIGRVERCVSTWLVWRGSCSGSSESSHDGDLNSRSGWHQNWKVLFMECISTRRTLAVKDSSNDSADHCFTQTEKVTS